MLFCAKSKVTEVVHHCFFFFSTHVTVLISPSATSRPVVFALDLFTNWCRWIKRAFPEGLFHMCWVRSHASAQIYTWELTLFPVKFHWYFDLITNAICTELASHHMIRKVKETLKLFLIVLNPNYIQLWL